jgi:hypothetical protein
MSDEGGVSLESTMRALLLASLRSLDTDSQIEILLKAGFSNPVVADLTGITANAVALRKARLKRKAANR